MILALIIGLYQHLPDVAAALLLLVVVHHLATDDLHPRMELKENYLSFPSQIQSKLKSTSFELNTDLSVVQEVGHHLQDTEADHGDSCAYHEVVGVGVGYVLLSLRPDCTRQ